MYFIRKEIEKDIETLADMLKSTRQVDEYKYLKCNISLLLDLYKNVYHSEYKVIVPNIPLFDIVVSREDKSVNQLYREEYLNNREYHDEIIKSVYEIMSKYNLVGSIKQEPIRLDYFLDIINSFFCEFGGKQYETYQELLKKAHIDYFSIKANPSSETNHIFMLGKSYVTINARNDVEGLLVFAHEIGHAYANSMIKNNKASYDDCISFYEFYSSFMERIMIDYLLRNNIMVEDTKKSNYNYFKYFKKYARDLSEFKDFSLAKILENNSKLSDSMIYFYGEYLGIIKESDYYDDKEGTIERINDYLRNQSLVSREKSLDILGIDYDELISGKKLKRILNKNNM